MAEGENFTIPAFPETTDDMYYDTDLITTTHQQGNSSGISTASILITGIMLSVHMIWSRLRSKFVSAPSKNVVNNPEIPKNLAQMKQL